VEGNYNDLYILHKQLAQKVLEELGVEIDEKNRISFLDHLYETQENWIKGKTIKDINQNLKKTVKKFGLSEKDFDKCLDFEDVENHILNSRIEAVKNFKINSTPKVIINDKVFKDTLEYKNLKRAIEKLI